MLNLSPEQLQAVRHVAGPAVVLAGPGSGKTRTIVNRLQFLIESSGIRPSSILTLTFTRMAALEMRSRAEQLLGENASHIHFGTFHSIFFQVLKHFSNYSADNIIKSQVQAELAKDTLDSLKIEPQGGERSVRELLGEVSRVKTSLSDPGAFKSSCLDPGDFNTFFHSYCGGMKKRRLIDFDDMLLLSRALFLNNEAVLSECRSMFRFILVDEAQDMDRLQLELVRLLARPGNNLMLVGDDDQSIYGFRGADPGVMRFFLKELPEAILLPLSVNYRSYSPIVEAAGRVISNNTERLEKKVSSGRGPGGGIKILSFKGREEEYRALQDYLKPKEGKYSQICLLFRSNQRAEQAAAFLSSINIPYRSREKLNDIYQHFIARDIMDYCRLADGCTLRSTLYRIMNHPYRGISRNAVKGDNFCFEEIKKYHRADLKAASAAGRLERDIGFLSGMQPYAAIHYLLHGMGYGKYLKDMAGKRGIEAEEYLNIAQEIRERAKGHRSFKSFFEAAEEFSRSLAEAKRNEAGVKDSGREAVSIMTLHGSKGLEFKEVWVFGLNEGEIPSVRQGREDNLEEERRLFYVGMTRAENRLILSYIEENQGKALKPSRFLKELGEIT